MHNKDRKHPLTLSLLKSLVSAHLRHYKSGKISQVAEHEDSRRKRELPPGTAVYFRTADGKRARRGHIIGTIEGGYHVQGRREAGKFKAPTFRLTEADVWAPEEQAAKKQASGKFEALSSSKRIISVDESNRRARVGYERLGLAEKEIVTHPDVRKMKVATLKRLAAQNGIIPAKDGSIDADFADANSHYNEGLITALRHEASKAPKEDLQAFKDHLAGKRNESRIFATITIAGRNAARNFIADRNRKKKELIDFQSGAGVNDEENHVDYLRQFSVDPTQEEDFANAQRDEILHGYLKKLAPVAMEIIQRKFAISGIQEPQSDAKIAAALNAKGLKYQDRYTWTRNNVAEAYRAALAGFLKLEGIEALRDFLKSIRESLTLLKSKNNRRTRCRTTAGGKG